MSDLPTLERELAQHQDDLATCQELLSLDPESADGLEMKALAEEQISAAKAAIAALKSAAPPPPPPAADAPSPTYDMAIHPKHQSNLPPPPPPPPAESNHDTTRIFEVKDAVMAKWSEDRSWYPATVVSKTGSATEPVYKVTFKGYGNTETKRKHEIRAPHSESKKRKADAVSDSTTPVPPPAAPVSASPQPQNGTVISAAPSVNPAFAAKKEPSKVSDGPTREAPAPKKLKGNKALDKAKTSWQDWQKSGPKKGAAAGKLLGEDSQFRTYDKPGKGKPAARDHGRTKWTYGREDD